MFRSMRLQHIRIWPPAWKAFLSACCCENESEIGFLTVTSSCGYQDGFSTETSLLLGNTTNFYDWLVNKLLSYRENGIIFRLFQISLQLLLWIFCMENCEILGFQFESTNTLQPDSSREKVWKFVYQQMVNQALSGETKHQLILGAIICFNSSQISATKECLYYHELNKCEYFKTRRFYIYLLTILQIFFIKLINSTLLWT